MKVKTWFALALVAVLSLGMLGLVGCNGNEGSGTGTGEPDDGELSGSINIEGSDTMVNMGASWAMAFMTENPGVQITVQGGGSGTGIAALINGTVDFANASRGIKDEEVQLAQQNGVEPVEHEVAIDGIAVVANAANPVTGLTLDQLSKIYTGEITNWKDVGGPDKEIIVLSRDSSSGTYEYFKEEVVMLNDEDAEYAPTVRALPSNQAQVDEIKNNDAAIGYIGLGYVTPDVKVLEVDGVAASVETAKDQSYVLSRYLYMYSNGEPQGVMASYLEWIQGPEGQEIVVDEGFVPLQ